jgi:hypothetical protein
MRRVEVGDVRGEQAASRRWSGCPPSRLGPSPRWAGRAAARRTSRGRPARRARGRGGSLPGSERDDRVDRRVGLGDPGQHGGEQFGGGEFPGPDQPGELNGRGSRTDPSQRTVPWPSVSP